MIFPLIQMAKKRQADVERMPVLRQWARWPQSYPKQSGFLVALAPNYEDSSSGSCRQ